MPVPEISGDPLHRKGSPHVVNKKQSFFGCFLFKYSPNSSALIPDIIASSTNSGQALQKRRHFSKRGEHLPLQFFSETGAINLSDKSYCLRN
jgi:hypothetical protein